MAAGERHLRDATDHGTAAELLATLMSLQHSAEGRPLCWSALCSTERLLLPRLLHGALHWCSQATLPALKAITLALSAKAGKGCAHLFHQ